MTCWSIKPIKKNFHYKINQDYFIIFEIFWWNLTYCYDLKIKLSSDIFNLLGRVYMKAKNWEQAVITFEKSIEFNAFIFHTDKA